MNLPEGVHVRTLTVIDDLGRELTLDIELKGSSGQFDNLAGACHEVYAQTSFNDDRTIMFADLAIRNELEVPISGPVLIGIRNITEPSVSVANPDGITADGIPFLDFSSLIGPNGLESGQSSLYRSLVFHNPQRTQFRYDLVCLGILNRPPYFISVPQIEAYIDLPYLYDSQAVDPDEDTLSYRLLTAPSGMSIDSNTGAISWSPRVEDMGTHEVLIEVDDHRSGTDTQRYTLNVTEPPPNRPPVITTDPVIKAMGSGGVTGVVQVADLSEWEVIQFDYANDSHNPPNANWAVDLGSTSVTQTVNADPSFLMSDFVLEDSLVTGSWRVNTTQDDDYMGFVFGYQNSSNFYLFQWGQGNENSIPGMRVSLSQSPSDTPENMFPYVPSSGSGFQYPVTNQFYSILYQNQIPWSEYIDYRFELDFHSGVFTIGVYDGTNAIDFIAIEDETFSSGRFGFFNASLGNISYTGFATQRTPIYSYIYDIEAVDVDGDDLAWELVSGPLGMQIVSGIILWNPSLAQIGVHTVVVQVEDGRGGFDRQTYEVTYCGDPNNNAPIFVSQPPLKAIMQTGAVNIVEIHYIYSSMAIDPDGDVLAYSILSAPSGTVVDVESGLINFDLVIPDTQLSNWVGDSEIVIQAVDGRGGIATQAFTLLICQPGVGSISGTKFENFGETNQSSLQDWHIYIDINMNGLRDAGEVSLQTDSNGMFLFENLPAGTYTIREEVSAGWQQTYPNGVSLAGDTFVDTVVEYFAAGTSGILEPYGKLTNQPWNISIDPQEVVPGGLPAQLVGSQPLAEFISIPKDSYITLAFNDEIVVDGPGPDILIHTITDHANERADVFVREAGGAFVFVQTVGEGGTTSIDLNDIGFQGIVSEIRIVGLDNLGSAPGFDLVAVQALPDSVGVGDNSWTITLADGMHVQDVDFGNRELLPGENFSPQFITDPVLFAIAESLYAYPSQAEDPEATSISYELLEGPPSMIVAGQSGEIYWTPRISDIGTHPVIIRAVDEAGRVSLQSFDLLVIAPNSSPFILSEPPVYALVGLPLEYPLVAQDAEQSNLVYSIIGGPAGSIIDSAGLFTWIPTASQLGTQAFFFSVSDGVGGETLQQVDLEVLNTAPNDNPVILSATRVVVRSGSQYGYPVVATDPNADPLTYSLPTAPSGMAIDAAGVVLWSPLVADEGLHPIVIRIEDGRGGAAEQVYELEVISLAVNRSPAITSSPRLSTIVGNVYAYNALAADPDGDTVQWSLDASPPGMSVNPVTGEIRWIPTLGQLGDHPIELRATDIYGASVSQSFVVTARIANLPPRYTTIPPTTGSIGGNYLYVVGAIDPDADPVQFSLDLAPAGMSINSTNGAVAWTPAIGQQGTNAVIIRIADGLGGVAQQSYAIEVEAVAPNLPPVFVSVPFLNLLLDAPYDYQAVAQDPEGQVLTYSLIQGPAGMSMDASGLVSWTPVSSDAGEYIVVIRVLDSSGAGGVQRFTLSASENMPPAFSSEPVLQVAGGGTYRYRALASDPENQYLTYTLISGPAGLAMDAQGLVSWDPAISASGSYMITVEVEDEFGATDQQSWSLEVTPDSTPPSIELLIISGNLALGGDPTLTYLSNDLIFVVQAVDDVGVVSQGLIIDGNPLTLDASGEVGYYTDVSGILTLEATASDSAGNVATVSRQIRVVDLNDNMGPVVEILAPTNGIPVSPFIDVTADIYDPDGNFSHYTVDWAPAYTVNLSTLQGDSFRSVTQGTDQVFNQVVFTLDTTLIQNDGIVVKITGWDSNGQGTIRALLLNLNSQLKLGRLALEFTDLEIPLAGIPITIFRRYDSFDASRQGDFGYGWSLGFADANIRETVPDTGSGIFGGATPFMVDTRVYITTPEGERVGFTYKPTPGPPSLLFSTMYPRFEADPGVYYELRVPEHNQNVVTFNGNGEAVISVFSSFPYNPDEYLLVAPDGTEFHYDQRTGLDYVEEPNGNRLTYTDGGIFHSGGESIEFIRDVAGRITEIIDPAGNSITYSYDPLGDLVAVTDQEGLITSLSYLSDPKHYLESIMDPRGVMATRYEYDVDGRLVAEIDPEGNRTEFAFDPGAFTGTIRDERGFVTELVYDLMGNIIQEIKPNGSITIFEYTDPLNPTKETAVIDASGQRTDYFHNNQGEIVKTVYPNGSILEYDYENSNLAEVKFLDLAGSVLASQSANYSSSGDLLQLTNCEGVQKNYSYQNGNLVSQSDYQGNIEAFEYLSGCGCGLPSKIIAPDGSFSEYSYNVFGKPSQYIDEFGQASNFEYDAIGRLTAEVDPSGNRSELVYDANGNLISRTDFEGRVREFKYDDLNRVVEFIEHTSIPALASTALITKQKYDEAGNLKSVTDPSGNIIQYSYDPNGDLIGYKDALGNSERYFRNLLGQTTSIVDRVGSKRSFVFNAIGQVTAESWIDPSGLPENQITYSYDSLGRLISAVDQFSNYQFSYFGGCPEIRGIFSPGSAQYPAIALDLSYDADGRIVLIDDGSRSLNIIREFGRPSEYSWRTSGTVSAEVAFDYSANRLTEISRLGSSAGSLAVKTIFNYTVDGFPSDASHFKNASPLLSDSVTAYNYDAEALITNLSGFGNDSSFTSDNLGQILTASHSSPYLNDESFAYDPSGNRISDGAVIGLGNQLLSNNVYQNTYDLNGSLISRLKTATGGLDVFQYDARKRLVAVARTDAGGVTIDSATFKYDMFDRMISRVVSGVETRSVYLGDNPWTDFDSANQHINTYLFGEDADSLYAIADTSGNISWQLSDKIGSVIAETSLDGSILSQSQYSTFGVQVAAFGLPTSRFGFTGRERIFDDLYHYRGRTYQPSSGRFLSEDRIGLDGGDYNFYRYVYNSPLNFTDPFGTVLVGYSQNAKSKTKSAPAVRCLGNRVSESVIKTALIISIATGSASMDPRSLEFFEKLDKIITSYYNQRKRVNRQCGVPDAKYKTKTPIPRKGTGPGNPRAIKPTGLNSRPKSVGNRNNGYNYR